MGNISCESEVCFVSVHPLLSSLTILILLLTSKAASICNYMPASGPNVSLFVKVPTNLPILES